MRVTFLYYEDCPSYDQALERLRSVMAEEQIVAALEIVKVETEEQAEHFHFVGSPTMLIDGHDIVPPPADGQNTAPSSSSWAKA